MAFLFNKTVLVIMLCLIFVGQSMASVTMFYEMAAMSSSKSTVHSKMNASKPAMRSMSHCDENSIKESPDSQTKEQCCSQDCQCFTGSCSTASAFSKFIAYSGITTTSVKITSINHNPLTQTLPSLYRPPILG